MRKKKKIKHRRLPALHCHQPCLNFQCPGSCIGSRRTEIAGACQRNLQKREVDDKAILKEIPETPGPPAVRRSYQPHFRKHADSTFPIDLPSIILYAPGKLLVVQGLILVLKVTRILPPQPMMNLLLLILPLHSKAAYAASEISRLVF